MVGTLKPFKAEEERFPDGILKPALTEERLILLGLIQGPLVSHNKRSEV